jgi:hypothetical protein
LVCSIAINFKPHDYCRLVLLTLNCLIFRSKLSAKERNVCVILLHVYNIVRLKHSHYRLMGPERFWKVKASRFCDIGTMKVVGCQPYTPAIYTPSSILVLVLKGTVNFRMPRKNSPVIPPGIEPGTILLVGVLTV